ncbi:DUF4276 family protein [Candidatus Poribacteria bacterium]|nr:DUF4276 family protein [Candidatus Poribacteria bacterium]MXY26735.1 DUF4276 family protein [Candidatus Poribacteria bacterium]MYK19240.1 DUF4276 family protein [Candidatus Poribacteria bacterium]
MTVKIGCIVEGESEIAAVPLLIRRIAADLYPELPIVVPPPIRRPRNKVIKENELERAVEFVARQIGGQGAIFIILDSDDDCPAELGPALLHRASQTRSDLPIAVVLAKHEFEAWFLAAAESIRGQRGLGDDIHPPNDPETIRDAKRWLSQRMERNKTYSETSDQPALTALFDIEQARQANSFDKCYRDIVRLLDELRRTNYLISEQS